MDEMHKSDGFSGQIQYVIPDRILGHSARHILVSGLYPTDVGWYPKAQHHFRRREKGAAQHILILCIRGSGWFEMGGARRALHQNHALLIPAGSPHTYGASERKAWSIHWLHFLGDDAPYFFTLLRRNNPVVPVEPALVPKLEALFTDATNALSAGFTQQAIIGAAQAMRHLLGLLFFSNRAFHPRTKAPSAETIESALGFMRERVDAMVSVEELARCTQLSATHFSRLFRQHTGFAPMEYFTHLKIQRACRFLTLTPLSVKEIAARIGYDDPYYFSRVFRRVMGTPPVAYRKAKLGATLMESNNGGNPEYASRPLP
jgi:AraC-like DNA-binding protein